MDTINFDSGLKSFALDNEGKRTITFNPSDFAIITRFNESKDSLEQLTKSLESRDKLNESEAADVLKSCDNSMRKIIDYVLNAPVCDAAFGGTNCCSYAGGQIVAINFLNAVLKVVKDCITEQAAKTAKNVQKYTSQMAVL
jgi:hypothetical protein